MRGVPHVICINLYIIYLAMCIIIHKFALLQEKLLQEKLLLHVEHRKFNSFGRAGIFVIGHPEGLCFSASAFETLGTILSWCRGVAGGPLIVPRMMPRGAKLSSSCTPDRCRNSRTAFRMRPLTEYSIVYIYIYIYIYIC